MKEEFVNDMTKEKKDGYKENDRIKACVAEFHVKEDGESATKVLLSIVERILNEGEAPTPMVDHSDFFNQLTLETILEKKEFVTDREVRMTVDLMQSSDEKKWIPLFTGNEEIDKGITTNIRMNVPIRDLVNCAFSYSDVEGLVINPFGESMALPKGILSVLLGWLEESERSLEYQEEVEEN